jgi:membrane associated rhomboid family serine protease
VPYVNYGLLIANLVVFVWELSLTDEQLREVFYDWGATPQHISNYFTGGDAPDRTPLTLFTSMFLHGGWLHFLGNMLFLWIFGDNVEDSMGHRRYLLFYVLAGLVATGAQVMPDPESTTPSVGASGAIAGVMGAYIVLYPRARVTVLLPILLFWAVQVPAFLLIGIWFAMNVFSGVMSLQEADINGAGGIAWFAHIGGFVFGAATITLFRRRRRRPLDRYRVFARGPWD